MTHESEATYEERVVAALEDMYGEGNIITQKRFDVTGSVCDIVVRRPIGLDDFAIELENDADSVRGGAAQAAEYADQINGRGVVLVEPGHINFPEVVHVDANVDVHIFQWDPPEVDP